jgi:hypothetical protein
VAATPFEYDMNRYKGLDVPRMRSHACCQCCCCEGCRENRRTSSKDMVAQSNGHRGAAARTTRSSHSFITIAPYSCRSAVFTQVATAPFTRQHSAHTEMHAVLLTTGPCRDRHNGHGCDLTAERTACRLPEHACVTKPQALTR